MPTSKQLQATINDQEDTLDQVSTLVEEALDAELSREEVISKLKEIQELLPEAEETEEEDESQD